jgi:hypothetical protein
MQNHRNIYLQKPNPLELSQLCTVRTALVPLSSKEERGSIATPLKGE